MIIMGMCVSIVGLALDITWLFILGLIVLVVGISLSITSHDGDRNWH